MKVYPDHINDPEFGNALVESFLEISKKTCKDAASSQHCESSQELQEDFYSRKNTSGFEIICYSPSNFPDARPGFSHTHFCLILDD